MSRCGTVRVWKRPRPRSLLKIPRSFDSARLFYNENIPPIFEVILPMTTTSKCDQILRKYLKKQGV